MNIYTVQQIRYFRKMERGILVNLYRSCNHRYYYSLFSPTGKTMYRCRNCAIEWYFDEDSPERGNPHLWTFLQKCQHLTTQSAPTQYLTHNECLECGEIIEKTEMGKAWKQVRTTATDLRKQIFKNITQLNRTIIEPVQDEDYSKYSPETNVRYVWDPSKYGEKNWGIEFN